MLKSLTLENFTVFPSAHFEFSPGINAFVEEELPLQPIGQQRMMWSQTSGAGLANAYGEDESEYTLADLCL